MSADGAGTSDPIEQAAQTVEQTMAAQARNERSGQVAPFTCPECGGALWQLNEPRLIQFRCHVGHAYNREALLSKQSEALEAALWTAVRTFREKSVLGRPLADTERRRGDATAAARFDEQAERYATLIVEHVLQGNGGTPDTPRQRVAGMNPDEPLPTGHEPPAANPPGADAAARRERYQGSFEFAADAQFVTDGSGVILEANDAAAVLVGYRKEFLPGKPLALLATERLRTPFYECLTRLGQGSLAEAFEARFTRSGGESRDTQVMARPGAPGTILWLVRDVTAWRRNEVARVELQLRLGASQEDERRRLSRDLHDTVGQTLTAVTLSLHAVRATGPLPEAALARLDQVQKLADELGRQLHDVAVRLRPTALDDLGLEAAA